MFEPITLLTGFLTMWAQLNNYGIDVQKSPHLKNVRVKRYIPEHDLKDSLIIKNINARFKRQIYNGNNNMPNDYVETIIPLANYPPNSEYYSQNTAGVPYYYNAYNGNNKVFYGNNEANGHNNVYNGNNNAYNANNNGYNGNAFGQRDTVNVQNYRINEKSGKLVTYPNDINLNKGTIATSKQYNPFPSNTNVVANNNGNNNGLNNGLNNGNNSISDGKKNETLLIASIIGSSGCSGYLKSVKIFGTQVCMSDDY